MSINDELLQELDTIQSELGFSGRSEVIRAGVRMLLDDSRQKTKLKGALDAILLVIHSDAHSHATFHARHDFQSIIRTQLHNHLQKEKCLEIFILHGDAKQVLELEESFKTNKKIDYVKLIVS